MKTHFFKGYGIAIFAAICFGSVGTISKSLLDQGLSVISLTVITSLGFIILGVSSGLATSFKNLRIPLSLLLLCVLQGAVLNTLSRYFFFMAIQQLPVAICSTIMFCMVFPTMFVSRFLFHESLSLKKIVLSGIALLGVGLALNIFQPGNGYSLRAIIYISLTTVICAGMNLISNYVLKRGATSIQITPYSNLSTLVAVVLIQSPVKTLASIGEVIQLDMTSNLLLMILLAGVSVGSIVFFIHSMKHISLTDATIFLSFDPITATILGMLVFGQALLPIQLWGGSLIIISVVGVSLSDLSFPFTIQIKKRSIVFRKYIRQLEV